MESLKEAAAKTTRQYFTPVIWLWDHRPRGWYQYSLTVLVMMAAFILIDLFRFFSTPSWTGVLIFLLELLVGIFAYRVMQISESDGDV